MAPDNPHSDFLISLNSADCLGGKYRFMFAKRESVIE